MLDFGRTLLAISAVVAVLAITSAFASPIEFAEVSEGDGPGLQKRYSEFLGGPGKRSMDAMDDMPQKRYSEFLGGPGKRYSEFLGGPGKRSRQENMRQKAREALRMILAGMRPQDIDDRR